MGSKQRYNKKKKMLAVVQAAEELFLAKSYSAITVDDVARRAGVTKRTLYSYFPSKLALFIHMFDDYLQRLYKEHLELIAHEWPADRCLREWISLLFRFTKKNEKFMRLFWTLDSDEFNGEIPAELIHRIKLWNRTMIDKGIEVMEKGQKEGVLYPCDPELLLHTVSAFNKGIFIHTYKESSLNIAKVDPEELLNLFMEFITYGLFPKKIERPGYSN